MRAKILPLKMGALIRISQHLASINYTCNPSRRVTSLLSCKWREELIDRQSKLNSAYFRTVIISPNPSYLSHRWLDRNCEVKALLLILLHFSFHFHRNHNFHYFRIHISVFLQCLIKLYNYNNNYNWNV